MLKIWFLSILLFYYVGSAELRFIKAFCYDIGVALRAVGDGISVKKSEVEVNLSDIDHFVVDADDATIESCKRFFEHDAWKLLKQTCKFKYTNRPCFWINIDTNYKI